MRRKSSRNLAKSSPEKVQQTETPVRKSRRNLKRRKRSSSSDTGNSEEEQEVKSVERPSTEEENSKSDTILIADDADKVEDVQLKLTLSRDSTASPKRQSKDRQCKAGISQEEKLPNQEVVPTRRSRRRGSPKAEESTHQEDEEDKKGKGKSKGKSKSKIEKIHPLNELDAHNECEISENVQVTPESPQTNTDNPVDNEHVTVNENVENSEDGTKGESDNVQAEEGIRTNKSKTHVHLSSPKRTNNEKSKDKTSLNINETEDASENSSKHPSDQQNLNTESTNQSPDKGTEEAVTGNVNQGSIGSWEERDEEIVVSIIEEVKYSGENDQVTKVVQSEIVMRYVKDNKETAEEVNMDAQHTNLVQEEREKEEQEDVQQPIESERKEPECESENLETVKEKQEAEKEQETEREEQVSEKEPENEKNSESTIKEPETEKDQEITVEEPETVKDQEITVEEPETEKDQEITVEEPETEKNQESTMAKPAETWKDEHIIKEDEVRGKEDLEMETRNSIFTAEGRNIKSQSENKIETKTKSRKKKVEISRNFDDESRRKIAHRKKWGSASVGLNLISPRLIPVDLDIIKTFCQSFHFLEETEVALEHVEAKDRRRSIAEQREKKVERKVSLDDSVRVMYSSQLSDNSIKSEENLEGEIDNSNIIAMNRKISIVDDSASKLKPPPSPAKNPISEVLYITNLVRPFTLKQLKELLERTGKIMENGFWTDRIKSKCYVQYETVTEAEATRDALHGVHWPIGNGKKLIIDYATTADLENARNPPPPPAPVVPDVNKNEKENKEEQKKVKQEEEELTNEREREREKERHRSEHVREWDVGKENLHRRHSRSSERHEKRRHSHHSPSPIDDFISRKQKKVEEQLPQKLMDDLFLKTKATPSIYWQPLTPEEIATKQQQRLERMAEHKRRMEETSRNRAEYGRGGPYRRRYD